MTNTGTLIRSRRVGRCFISPVRQINSWYLSRTLNKNLEGVKLWSKLEVLVCAEWFTLSYSHHKMCSWWQTSDKELPLICLWYQFVINTHVHKMILILTVHYSCVHYSKIYDSALQIFYRTIKQTFLKNFHF